MIASHPLGVLTPSCKGSKISRARSVIKSTATLLVSRRMVSPMAIGRKDPFGLRSAMMEAPQTYGRIGSGTSPEARDSPPQREAGEANLKRPGAAHHGRAKDEGPTDPLPRSRGKREEPSEPAPCPQMGPPPKQLHEGNPSPHDLRRKNRGEGGEETRRHHPWDGPGGSCSSAAQARRRAFSWMRVVTLAMTEAERTPPSSSSAGGSRPLDERTDGGSQRSALMQEHVSGHHGREQARPTQEE